MSPSAKTAETIDRRATRFLARAAFDAGALDPVSWEFVCDFPERADEVLEFSRWLAEPVGGAS